MVPTIPAVAEQVEQSPLILVVDDDPAIRQLYQAIFADEGYRTLLVAEAATAVELIRTTRPSLIVLDLWIERADAGWGIMARLHRTTTTRALPVLICSGNAFMLATMAELHAAPHHAFLAKPFATDALVATVAGLLRLRR